MLIANMQINNDLSSYYMSPINEKDVGKKNANFCKDLEA